MSQIIDSEVRVCVPYHIKSLPERNWVIMNGTRKESYFC